VLGSRLDVTPEEITDGPVAPTLLALAAPLIAQNLVHVLNQVVDTFWLGRVDEPAVAAVGLNFPVLAVLFGLVTVGIAGTHILVAQRVGAEETAAARRLAVNGTALSAALGLVLAVGVVLAAETVIDLLGAGPAVGPLAVAYLTIVGLFFPFAAASDTIERGFVGWGDTRAALYINLVTVATNVALDPFLILGVGPVPALGVEGAALATGLGYAAGLAAAVALVTGRRSSLALSRADLAVSRSDLREIVGVGAPLSGQQLAGQSARVAIVGVVATVGGAPGLAAYTVGARVASVAFVPAAGFGNAAQSMIGQNLGAERPDRAGATVRAGVLIAAGVLGLVGLVQWLVPGSIAGVFVPSFTEAGRRLTVAYLEILAYSYWAMGASSVVLAAFNGASRTRTSFVVDLVKYWGLRIPAAVAALPPGAYVIAGVSVGGLDLGVRAIFWAVTVSNVAAAVGAGLYYLWRREPMFGRAVAQAAD